MGWTRATCVLFMLLMLAGTASATTGHFTVTDSTGSPHDYGDARLLDALEDAYGYVNRTFGTCPDHVEVIVVDKKAMDSVGEQVDSFSAWNPQLSAVVLRRETLTNKTALPVLARHEMTHLAINDILSKKDCEGFHWMEEGICMVVSKEPLDDVRVAKDILRNGFLDTAGIASSVKDENCSVSKNGYMQSYSLVRYIVRRYGMDALIKIMECPETSPDKAFRRCTGEGFEALYGEWVSDVKKTASG